MPVTHTDTQTENTVSSTVLGLESIKPCGNVGYKEILLQITLELYIIDDFDL